MAQYVVPAGSEESAESAAPSSYPQAASPAAAPTAAEAPQSPVMLSGGDPEQVPSLAGTPPSAPVPETVSEHSPLAAPAPAEAPSMSPQLSQTSPMLPPWEDRLCPSPSHQRPAPPRCLPPQERDRSAFTWRSPAAHPLCPIPSSSSRAIPCLWPTHSQRRQHRASNIQNGADGSVSGVVSASRSGRSASPARGQSTPPPQPRSQSPPALPSHL